MGPFTADETLGSRLTLGVLVPAARAMIVVGAVLERFPLPPMRVPPSVLAGSGLGPAAVVIVPAALICTLSDPCQRLQSHDDQPS